MVEIQEKNWDIFRIAYLVLGIPLLLFSLYGAITSFMNPFVDIMPIMFLLLLIISVAWLLFGFNILKRNKIGNISIFIFLASIAIYVIIGFGVKSMNLGDISLGILYIVLEIIILASLISVVLLVISIIKSIRKSKNG